MEPVEPQVDDKADDGIRDTDHREPAELLDEASARFDQTAQSLVPCWPICRGSQTELSDVTSLAHRSNLVACICVPTPLSRASPSPNPVLSSPEALTTTHSPVGDRGHNFRTGVAV